VVTNDFPPRTGGIQTFVHELVKRLDVDELTVLTSRWSGDVAFDRAEPYEVVRQPTSVLLPTPATRHAAVELVRSRQITSVLFGAAAPLGLLAPALRRAGVDQLVALTHGHEAGWAQLPGARQLLRRIGDGVDVVTYLGAYTHRRIGAALSKSARQSMVRLTPGVDCARFAAGVDGSAVRSRYGLQASPVIVCVSRLMPRKGQDTLILALPQIRARVPGTHLLLVGSGPYRAALERLVTDVGVAGSVTFTGPVAQAELPQHYAAGDVFAMPCRTRRAGLDVEGLGIVYLEASAAGLPVVAGDSGGAPDAVLDGETGVIVDGRSQASVVEEVSDLLVDVDKARRFGDRGRRWVQEAWGWDAQAERLGGLLSPTSP
jgi:phosphatidylinositol alpha-1,6-mannosyltransferase